MIHEFLDAIDRNNLEQVSRMLQANPSLANQQIVDPPDEDEQSGPEFRYPLHHVIRRGINSVRMLMSAGADANALDSDGNSPLHLAVGARLDEIVQVLIQHGVNCNLQNRNGNSPLHRAVSNHQGGERAKVLIASGAKLDIRNANGDSPLHISVSLPEPMKVLLSAGAAVNARNTAGETALHLAMHEWDANEECIAILLQSGADIHARTNQGDTPLHYLVKPGKKPTLISVDQGTIAAMAATELAAWDRLRQNKDLQTRIWRLAIQHRADFSVPNQGNLTPLQIAKSHKMDWLT